MTPIQEYSDPFRAVIGSLGELVSNLPLAVYLCEDDASWSMHVLSEGIEAITGYPASDFVRNAVRSFASIIHQDDAPGVREAIDAAADTFGAFELEYRIHHRDGDIRWIMEKGRFVDMGEGPCLVGVIIDHSEQQRRNEELQRARRRAEAAVGAHRRFVADVSRDIRTPLNTIHNLTRVVLRGELSDVQRRYLKTVDRAASDLMRLVEDGLRFPRSPSIPSGTTDPTGAVPSLGGARVLLVEDGEANQMVIRALLTRLGVDIDVAENGLEATQMVGERRYDLVLMDIRMPVMDGLEATRRIRVDHTSDSLPIVALTANVVDLDTQACKEAGMDGVLTKPVDRTRLLNELTRHLLEPGERPIDAPPGASTGLTSARERLGLPRDVFDGLLNQFVRSHRDTTADVEAALADGDLELARRLAHTLQGAAATLGLDAVAQDAADVERAVGTGQERTHVAAMRASVRRAVDFILSTVDQGEGASEE